MHPKTAAIEIDQLAKVYGETQAVSALSLNVAHGQIFGFLGPNGAGKTTTIRLLLGLQVPSGGYARVLGLDATRDSVAVHRRTGYIPGDLALYPRLTGGQHIEWFARARSLRDRRCADQLVERFQVITTKPVRELSKGNRQKLGLVLAFMHEPDVLILDEPTSGLDPLMQKQFEALVRETVSQGRTVFLSSHELDEVQRLADRVAIIRAGKLVTEGTVGDLRRAAPLRIDVRFAGTVDPGAFTKLEGVALLRQEPSHLEMEVTGALAPVFAEIARHGPTDVISRRASLDELFMTYYNGEPDEN